MRGIFVIFRKELKSYFNSPIAYIFIVVFLGLSYGLFIDSYFLAERNEMRGFFESVSIFFIVFIPAVTMRLWSEERKSGTIELLLTLPITKLQLVAGKYFAAIFFLAVALLFSLSIPIMMFALGEPDIGPIIGGYVGTMFLGCELVAIGMFLSTLCKDQIVAFILSLIVSVFLYLVGLPYISIMLDNTLPGVGSFLNTYYATPPHFESIQRGVIELRDFLYFFIISGTFFLLTIYYLEGHIRVQSKSNLIVLVILVMISCTFANMITSDVYGYRIDFTKDKIYTISDGSRSIIKSVKLPVRISYYVTSKEQMPSHFATLERDVTDVLKDLSSLSDLIDLETYYPDKDAKIMERLREINVQTYRIGAVEKFGRVEKIVNSSVVIEYFDRKPEVINGVFGDEYSRYVDGVGIGELEYKIVSRIYRMSKEERPVVAVVGPYKEFDYKTAEFMMKIGMGPQRMQNEDPFERVTDSLRESLYDVRRIKLDAQQGLPKDEKFDVMVVFSPKDQQLTERQIYEINKRLSSGTDCILALSSVSLEFDLGFSGEVTLRKISAEKINEPVINWLKGFGVTVENKFLMDTNIVPDHEVVQRVIGPIAFQPERVPIKHPTNFKIESDSILSSHPIMRRLKYLYFVKGSPLKLDANTLASKGLTHLVLAQTGGESWAQDFKQSLQPEIDFRAPSSFAGKQPVAILFEGQFPFEYSGKPVSQGGEGQPDEASSEQYLPPVKSRLILISSDQMFSDKYILDKQEEYDNLSFVLSSVDYLTDGTELTQIRSKKIKPDQLKKLSGEEKLFYKLGFGAAGPLLVIFFGIIRYLNRLKTRNAYFDNLHRQKK